MVAEAGKGGPLGLGMAGPKALDGVQALLSEGFLRGHSFLISFRYSIRIHVRRRPAMRFKKLRKRDPL